MSQSFYITTPIYYVNAKPHLGHAYTTIVADVAARFHRLRGDDVRFQTGTDEHGDKIAEAAAKGGTTPQAYADEISGLFRDTWPGLDIAPDNFIRTTDPDHVRVVQAILQRVYDAGDIYKDVYGGNYCVGCERFLTDKELVDGKCPEHGAEPRYIEEENYFFRMGKYHEALVDHISANPEFIRPERFKNEVLSMLAEPLDDLCISRPKSRLTWGITLPFDQDYVTYVWFDALINYVSGLGWPDAPEFGRYWPGVQHLIAKDILKPHAIFWPTMLMAADLPLYNHLNVHGYWNVGETKMSKSLGNVVAPLELADIYGVDAFRYFLMREMTYGLDASFSEELLVERYNADLANDLGNLTSRVLNMLHRYRDGVVPPRELPGSQELIDAAGEAWDAYGQAFDRFAFRQGLEAAWALIDQGNKYVVATQPWELAKDQANKHQLDNVLATLVNLLAEVAVMIQPVMPSTAAKLAGLLGLGQPDWPELAARMGRLELVRAHTATAKPEALFPRVDTDKVKAKAAKKEAKQEPQPKAAKKAKGKAQPAQPPAEIAIDQFAQVELKVGLVTEAKPVEGADRLLHLAVDLGEGQPRSIVAGIAQHFRPEEVVGRRVVVVANLKPVKLKGVPSQGMVLAAPVEGGGLGLVAPPEGAAPGARIK